MTASRRISAISHHLNGGYSLPAAQAPNELPWNPNNSTFPALKDLPRLPNAPGDAAWVWGEDDQVNYSNYTT